MPPARSLRVRCTAGVTGCGATRRKLGKMSELVYLGFGASPVDYLEGWDLQRRVHARRVADEIPDSCLLLEHAPV